MALPELLFGPAAAAEADRGGLTVDRWGLSPPLRPQCRSAAELLRGPRAGLCKSPRLSFAVITGAPMSRDLLLDRRGWETPELLQRARSAIDQLVAGRVGGDCWAPRVSATALP